MKKRIQFDIEEKELAAIDADRRRGKLATRAELFRRAMALYRLAVKADKVILVTGGKRERIVP